MGSPQQALSAKLSISFRGRTTGATGAAFGAAFATGVVTARRGLRLRARGASWRRGATGGAISVLH